MDATALGSVLALTGVISGAVVAYLGKRGENAITGYSSLTDNLQEERDRLDRQVAERDAEIVRLRTLLIELGGTP